MEDDLIRRVAVLKLIEDIKCNPEVPKNYGTLLDIMRAVREIPAAYDVDKVVEQLEEELSLADKEKERCARENPLQFDTAKGHAHGVWVSLEIVKSGGID